MALGCRNITESVETLGLLYWRTWQLSGPLGKKHLNSYTTFIFCSMICELRFFECMRSMFSALLGFQLICTPFVPLNCTSSITIADFALPEAAFTAYARKSSDDRLILCICLSGSRNQTEHLSSAPFMGFVSSLARCVNSF